MSVEMVHLAKYYSIVLDCTADFEEMSMINNIDKLQHSQVIVREHILGIIKIQSPDQI